MSLFDSCKHGEQLKGQSASDAASAVTHADPEPGLPAVEALHNACMSCQIVDSVNEGIIVYGKDMRYRLWNRRMEQLSGIPAADVLGRHPLEAFPFLENTGIIEKLEKTLAGELTNETSFKYVQPASGKTGWAMDQLLPLKDGSGAIGGAIGIVTEITEQKLIRDCHKFLAENVRSSGDEFFKSLAIFLSEILDMEHIRIEQLLDGGLTARTIVNFTDGVIENNFDYALTNTPSGVAAGEKLCCFPDGIRHHYAEDAMLEKLKAASFIGTTLWSESNQPIGLFCAVGRNPLPNRDLAEAVVELVSIRAAAELERRLAAEELKRINTELEQKIAERTGELHKTTLQLEGAQRQANLGSWNWIVETDTVTWSKQIYAITGLDPQSCRIKYEDQINLYSPESWARLDSAVKSALASGEAYELELELIRSDGARRICIAKGEVLRNDAGDVAELRGTLQDITDRVTLERQLHQAKRLEYIGQLAGGVAHEVRNPLNAILSINEALFREKGIVGNPEFEPYLHHIRTQITRLVHLMNDLLELGKPVNPSNIELVNLYDICRETISLWNSSGSARKIPVLLTSDEKSVGIFVSADRLKLQQAVFNLLENAAQNSQDKSKIFMTVSDYSISNDQIRSASIRIADSGKGIDDKIIHRIFEPFFTDRREGTGLGLTLVRHIIDNMGGTVSIFNNSPPPGCTAEIRLPQSDRGDL